MGGPRSRRHLLLFHLFYKLAYYDLHLGLQCYFACLSRVLDSEKCFDLDLSHQWYQQYQTLYRRSASSIHLSYRFMCLFLKSLHIT